MEGDKVFLPLYARWSPGNCWVNAAEVVAIHYGPKGLAAARLGELERARGRAFSKRERRMLEIPQYYWVVVVTPARVHSLERRWVRDLDSLLALGGTKSVPTARLAGR
jgi:hypothetical protein